VLLDTINRDKNPSPLPSNLMNLAEKNAKKKDFN
jgi:hypothetical protein